MNVDATNLKELLGGNTNPFFIPPFQRSYAWGEPELSRFYGDIVRLLKSEIYREKSKLQHFFGSLVSKIEGHTDCDVRILIDGQQRITTSLIFLIAARDTIANKDEKKILNNRFLISHSSKYPHGIKLKQVTSDSNCYEAIVMGNNAPLGPISYAYSFFCKQLHSLKLQIPDVTVQNILEVYGRINLAHIKLDPDSSKGEDPQIIFETLNSLGKPLTLADLIRNYILLGLSSEQQTEVYDNIWLPKIEHQFSQNELSNFFRDFCQYKLSEKLAVVSNNNTKELYAIFKERVACFYEDNEELISELSKVAHLYRAIVDNSYTPRLTDDKKYNKQVKKLLLDIFQEIKSDPFKSFVLGLLISHQGYAEEGKINDNVLIESLIIIRTYLVRRRVCNVAQGENKAVPLLCKSIPNIAKSKIKMINLLVNQGYNLRFPNDIELTSKLETIPFYNEVNRYVKFILGEMELTRSKVAVDYHDKRVTIEHIMPQTLPESWKEELGPDWERVHQMYLHNIGNLILTEFNGEMGNKEFATKKERLKKSSIGYRLDVIDVSKWNEEAIVNHRSKMIKLFLSTFQLPPEYRTSNNWNERIANREVHSFHPDNPNVQSIVTWNKPDSIKIEGKTYKVKTWKNILSRTIQHLKYECPNIYEQLIEDYNTSLKKGKTAQVVNWKNGVDLPLNPSYYKRFYVFADGTKVKDIDHGYSGDTRLIFYNNYSATETVEAVANLLQYFHIDSKEVEITLQQPKSKEITTEPPTINIYTQTQLPIEYQD